MKWLICIAASAAFLFVGAMAAQISGSMPIFYVAGGLAFLCFCAAFYFEFVRGGKR